MVGREVTPMPKAVYHRTRAPCGDSSGAQTAAWRLEPALESGSLMFSTACVDRRERVLGRRIYPPYAVCRCGDGN